MRGLGQGEKIRNGAMETAWTRDCNHTGAENVNGEEEDAE